MYTTLMHRNQSASVSWVLELKVCVALSCNNRTFKDESFTENFKHGYIFYVGLKDDSDVHSGRTKPTKPTTSEASSTSLPPSTVLLYQVTLHFACLGLKYMLDQNDLHNFKKIKCCQQDQIKG